MFNEEMKKLTSPFYCFRTFWTNSHFFSLFSRWVLSIYKLLDCCMWLANVSVWLTSIIIMRISYGRTVDVPFTAHYPFDWFNLSTAAMDKLTWIVSHHSSSLGHTIHTNLCGTCPFAIQRNYCICKRAKATISANNHREYSNSTKLLLRARARMSNTHNNHSIEVNIWFIDRPWISQFDWATRLD